MRTLHFLLIAIIGISSLLLFSNLITGQLPGTCQGKVCGDYIPEPDPTNPCQCDVPSLDPKWNDYCEDIQTVCPKVYAKYQQTGPQPIGPAKSIESTKIFKPIKKIRDLAFESQFGPNMILGDFDNDGDLDIVAVGKYSFDSRFFYIENDAGNFKDAVKIGSINNINTNLAAGDIDDDGDLDIIVITSKVEIYLLENAIK